MRTLVRSIDKQQRVINQDAKENALSIRDLTRTVDYNHRRFEKFEQEQTYKNQQFEYNESLRKHQAELDEQERQRENEEYQNRLNQQKQQQQREREQQRRKLAAQERQRKLDEQAARQRERQQAIVNAQNVESPVQPPIAEHEVKVEDAAVATQSPPVPVVNPSSLT